MALNWLSINVHTCILISLIYSLTVIISVANKIAITNDDTSTEIDGGPVTSAKIVDNIRKAMNNTVYVNVPVQAYIIPSVDAHQNEYPTIRDNRVRYVSGFTGSSATIVIEESAAAIWIPHPYYSQADREIDSKTWSIKKVGMETVPSFRRWLLETLPKSSRVGIDSYLIKSREFQDLNDFLEANGHKLVGLQSNLVDVVWKNRPEPKLNELEPIDQTLSGKKILEKFTDVRKALKDLNADSLIVTSLEDVAWLLNLRGSDFDYLPVFFAYAIITEKETYLYLMNHERATKNNKIDNHFQTEHIDITINEYNDTLAGINMVIRNTKGKMILSSASEAITSVVPIERRLEAESPILGMRIIKNEIEANGIREAHRRDGAAIIQYLYWLETEINDQNITEMKGAEKLKDFKRVQENYRRLGFATISAVGAHAAMVRYIPTIETDKQITKQEIYLLNAATQYKDGSATVARTVHIGNPSDKEKDYFTRVLKGFISVATAIFPPNAPFSYFDALARRSLWDVGLDYKHDTGHGIGAYLNLHEIPPLLSSKNPPPGGMYKNMFTTNEPGVYEDGLFGIRIENVLQVVSKSNSSKYFDGKGAYKFDDVTMVPIQAKLINVDLLTQSEVDWINAYHVQVRENISPLLSNNSNIVEWLQKQTQPISKKKENCK